MRLIGTVQANAKSITREGWLGMWADPDDHPHATELWETEYGDSSGKRLDRAVPGADLKRLTAAARHVKRYVDQHVAHTDSSAVAEPVTLTYDDLHDAVDVVGELFKKYHHLLTAESYGSLVPIDIHPSWEAVFTQPWKTQPPATTTSPTPSVVHSSAPPDRAERHCAMFFESKGASRARNRRGGPATIGGWSIRLT